MSPDCFQTILQHLRLNDSSLQKSLEKKGMIRLLLDYLAAVHLLYYKASQHVSMDEMMIGVQCKVFPLKYSYWLIGWNKARRERLGPPLVTGKTVMTIAKINYHCIFLYKERVLYNISVYRISNKLFLLALRYKPFASQYSWFSDTYIRDLFFNS